MYWSLLHEGTNNFLTNNGLGFEDEPWYWFAVVWQHGIPLVGLLIEQILSPSDYNWESLGFTLIGSAIYLTFDAIVTLASDGA